MDIWACGVIFAELSRYISQQNLQVLQIFSGSQCFPMSPRGTKMEADGYPSTEGHVLESVFDLIGSPKEVDLSFITDKDALAYIKKFKSRP